MTQKINIEHGAIENGQLILTAEKSVAISDLTAGGNMLVDSDNLAFIYICEQGGAYTYISIPAQVWPDLKTALNEGFQTYVSDGSSLLLLSGLKEEMEYLTENIKGNSNYGEIMVAAVENVF
ncbi:hypothetical protein [Mesobacillus zeae]|uniref:Uncharacterized protein n=1 Tax=Mesobacillus zeae TaxID=1917180 RepID=A0A398AYB1_9BACI|nr:hypothetical protein [Mesobacillus zeae]RID82044.1 hypothetical protein D1970_20220 [Mesobacillus zeae]